MGSKKRGIRQSFLSELVGKKIKVEIFMSDEEGEVRLNREGVLSRMNNGRRQGFYVNTSEGLFQIPIIYLSPERSTRKPGNERITIRLPSNYDLNSLQTY